MNAIRLYGRYVRASLHSQMRYPASFLLTSLGAFLATGIDFIAVWALFARFRQIAGWHFGEVALFYAVIGVSFALADGLTRGFDVFGEQFVRTGDFDRVLVRPRSTVLQLLGYEVRATRIGRLAQAVVVWIIATRLTHIGWTWQVWSTLLFAVAGGMALFSGILVLQATMAFWTVESLEIANTLSYGGVEAAQYPLDIYARWFRNFLTFVVPLGCVSYFPVASVLGRADRTGLWPGLLPFSPALGFVFLGVALWTWRFGVRRYASTGS
ncbi:MAG TPA: ABC-2 family transporter protein [Gemmatimonadaceae bacterium]|jgi:ABC-2 type transport system permease protein